MKKKIILIIILSILIGSFQLLDSRRSSKNQIKKKILKKNGKEILKSSFYPTHIPLKFSSDKKKHSYLSHIQSTPAIPGLRGIIALVEGSVLLLNPFNNTISGPFFAGQLGEAGHHTLTTAITSDGKTALIGSYESQKLYFIDLSNADNPIITGETLLSLSPEDITISPDNKHALITNGLMSTIICSVHIPTQTLIQELDVDPVYPSTVEIAPDGRTVITADVLASFADVFELAPSTGLLTYKYEIDIAPYSPTNVSISPKGDTVILSCGWFFPLDVDSDLIYGPAGPFILQIISPGDVIPIGPVGLPDTEAIHISGQSIQFDLNGKRAYYLTNKIIEDPPGTFNFPTSIRIFNVKGPGIVIDGGKSINLTNNGASPFSMPIGTNTLALSPDGNYLYVSNHGMDIPSKNIFIIDINSKEVIKTIPTPDVSGTDFPVGIAVPPGRADIEVNKSVNILKPYLGQEVTFEITVINHGPMEPKILIIKDKLPEGLEFVSSESNIGNYYQEKGHWEIPKLEVDQKATLYIKTLINKRGKITNFALIKESSLKDLRKSNNESSVELIVVEKADLQIDKAVDKLNTVIGEDVLYTITLSNLGPGNVENINILDKLPPSVDFLSYLSKRGTYNSQTGIWSIDSLKNNETVSLKIKVKPKLNGEIKNLTQIKSADVYDDNNKNDISQVSHWSYSLYTPNSVILQKISNDLGLYIEYLNKLTWEPNPMNSNNVAGYKIYRKVKDSSDSTYILISKLNNETFIYLDRDLQGTQKHTYKVQAFNHTNYNGIPVIISN